MLGLLLFDGAAVVELSMESFICVLVGFGTAVASFVGFKHGRSAFSGFSRLSCLLFVAPGFKFKEWGIFHVPKPSKARKFLESNGIGDHNSEDIIAQMTKKHPKRKKPITPLTAAELAHSRKSIDRKVFESTLTGLTHDTAP
eukprot:scaffold1017_cov33-Cyclotella_meneghiniana.AAC.1